MLKWRLDARRNEVNISRRKFPAYGGLRPRNRYRFRWVMRLRRVGIIAAFLVVLTSLSLFTNMKGDAYVVAPSTASERKPSVKLEVASSSTTHTKTATTKVTTASAIVQKIPMQPTIPIPVVARPAWLNLPLYVEPDNTATAYANANPTVPNVNFIARMGQQPVAHWFGDWDSNVTASISSVVSAANTAGAVPVLVFYNIPDRDCGGYSANGAITSSDYLQWVTQAAAGIANRNAVVILEPDAVAGADCLSSSDQQNRYQLISQAVSIIKAQANAYVYIDAGNPTWQTPATMASRLKASNIARADGFSMNVSNFSPTSLNVSYGEQLSNLVGGKHYVIDTSRSGGNMVVTGPLYNPPNASLGAFPTTSTANARNDADLWIKIPWESDAPVNGGPDAGVPYWNYAIQLAENSGW
jgi:endoglucanase